MVRQAGRRLYQTQGWAITSTQKRRKSYGSAGAIVQTAWRLARALSCEAASRRQAGDGAGIASASRHFRLPTQVRSRRALSEVHDKDQPELKQSGARFDHRTVR